MRSRWTVPHILLFAAIGTLAAMICTSVPRATSLIGRDGRLGLDGTAPRAFAAAQPAQTAGYVGSDTCEACHEQGEKLKGTPHAQMNNPRSPAAAHGCESCHGPGQAHVDDDD